MMVIFGVLTSVVRVCSNILKECTTSISTLTKSGSVDHELIGRKGKCQLHMTVEGILISPSYRWEQHPPNKSLSPRRWRQYTPPTHNNKLLQYKVEVQKFVMGEVGEGTYMLHIFGSYTTRSAQICQKSRNHLKILSAMTGSKFYTEDPHIY
jgi:hypothetical protein